MKKSKLKALIFLLTSFIFSIAMSACVNLDEMSQSAGIADEVAPIITIEGEKEYLLHIGDKLKLPKVTATDNKDDVLTSEVKAFYGETEVELNDYTLVAEKSGLYTVQISVADQNGNIATEEIAVHVMGENELNNFETATRVDNVRAKGIVNLSHNTDPAFVRYGEGSLRVEVTKHTSLSWPGIIVENLPVTDIIDYYSVSFWIYNDGVGDIEIYLQRNETFAGAKYKIPAKVWTKVEVVSRNYDNVFTYMESRGEEPEVGSCEDIKCLTFHLVNPANTPTFNIYVDEIVANKEPVNDVVEIEASVDHPVVNTVYNMPIPTLTFGGQVVDATVTYDLYDADYNKIEVDGNTHTFTKEGKYTLVINAEYNGLTTSKNYMLVCAKTRAANEIEFFEDESSLNFFKSNHFAISYNTSEYHTDNGSTGSMKLHACSSKWPYLTMSGLPYSDLERVAYIYFYAKTDFSLKEGQIAYLGIRDGGRGKVLKRLALSNDWQCFALTKEQLLNLGVTTLEGLQLSVELYDLSDPSNQGGWCNVAFNTYIDNFSVATIQDPIAKEDGVLLDFANYRDLDNLSSAYISYNFEDLSMTLNNKGSLKVYADGKWPEIILGSSFEGMDLTGVKNIVFEVLVPTINSGEYVRLGINDTNYKKVTKAGEWTSLYIPVESLGGNGLVSGTRICIARSGDSGWINVGTVYIGKIWLDYEGEPSVDVSDLEFTGAETETDLLMFRVENDLYKWSLNEDKAFVKEGNKSIKLNAVQRWPIYYFTQEFIDWLNNKGYEKISFDLYVDNAGSTSKVERMEGFAASYFVPDQWFTVTVEVKDLTTSSKLQFNKTPEGNLNIYLDNVRYYLPGFTSIEKEFDLGMFVPQNESLYLMELNSDSAFVSEGSYSIKFSSDSRWPRYYFTQSFIDWLNDMGYARISFELYIDTANGTANVSMTEGIYATSAPDLNAWVRIEAAVADLSADSFIQINKDTTGTVNFYVDNMEYYSAEPEHVKDPGVVLDFVTSKDTEDFKISATISYNTVKEYTVNGIGSLKILCEGKWPELNFGSTFSAYSMENVEKVGFMVYVPSIPDGGYVRLGINDKEYQRITKAGEWATLYVPASTITTATLEGIKVCISKHDGTGWCNVDVVYIGKMWLEYEDEPSVDVPALEFTGAETETDLLMFRVENDLYKWSLNEDKAFVKEGNKSIKLNAVQRWPIYYFTQEFIDWLNNKGYEKISFDLYVDNAGSTSKVERMEGFAASYFVPDQWFTVTVEVKDLTTSSKLQFNKTPEGNLNIYLDNVKFIK